MRKVTVAVLTLAVLTLLVAGYGVHAQLAHVQSRQKMALPPVGLNAFLATLNLTKQQSSQIRDIVKSEHMQATAILKQVRTTRQDAAMLLFADQPDQNKINADVQKLQSCRQKLIILTIAAVGHLSQVLTAKQRFQVRDKIQSVIRNRARPGSAGALAGNGFVPDVLSF
jgi:Spy/CpxP family protein refolding chaperone